MGTLRSNEATEQSKAQLSKAVETLQRRKKIIQQIPATPFNAQKKVIKSKSRFKLAVCPRRAGKTILSLYYLITTCILYPGCDTTYIALTNKAAKKIAWKQLKLLLKNIIPPENFNNSELTVKFPNGSMIYLAAGENQSSIEALRGQAYKLVVVDECASMSNLKYLVEDVLTMTLADSRGTLLLISTPSAPYGYFYECAQEHSNYSVFRWSSLDNPHLDKESYNQLVEKYAKNTPAYKREILAEFASAENAVFEYTTDNLVQQRDYDKDWRFVLGLDLGVRDDTAFTLVAYSDYHTEKYVVYSFKAPNMLIEEIYKKIKFIEANIAQRRLDVVYDSAALVYANELSQRYDVGMIKAIKKDKPGAIAKLNNLLGTKRLLIQNNCTSLLKELDTLVWADRKEEVWKDGTPDHLTDSLIYAINFIVNKAEPLQKDPHELKKQQMDPHERKLVNQIEEKKRMKELWGYDLDDYCEFL